MAEESDSQSGEKTEEPSAKRIEQFRQRGDVASSKELTGVLVLAASFLVLTLSIVYIYETLSDFVYWLYHLDLPKFYNPKYRSQIIREIFIVVFKCLGPIFLTSFCIGILSHIAQFGLLFSSEVLKFKPERINPISGFKRLFSMKSVVEALKGLLKFAVILSIVYFFLRDEINSYIGFFHLEIAESFLTGRNIIFRLSFSIMGGLLVVAIGDFAYQKYTHKKKMMQTKEEAKKERKEQDGSPEVRQKIRSIQRDMANKRMVEQIKSADVVVTNPTHISIVIKYDSETMLSPQVLAKGADNLAMRIREIAKEAQVPMVENVPLARSLYKTVKEGESVPRAMYKAVAEVLAFVYKMKAKEKALGVSNG